MAEATTFPTTSIFLLLFSARAKGLARYQVLIMVLDLGNSVGGFEHMLVAESSGNTKWGTKGLMTHGGCIIFLDGSRRENLK